MENPTEPAVAEIPEPPSIPLSLILATCATATGSILISAIFSGVVEGSDLLFAVAIVLILGGAGYLLLVGVVIPVICFAIAVDIGRDIMNALPAQSNAFFEEQDCCFCQCRHSIAWDDDIMCVIKKKTLSELTVDGIWSCDAFLPCDDEEKKI